MITDRNSDDVDSYDYCGLCGKLHAGPEFSCIHGHLLKCKEQCTGSSDKENG